MTRFRPGLHRLDERLTPASGLDPAYGIGGVARVSDPNPSSYLGGIEEALPDGGVLVANAVQTGGGGFQVSKLTAAGTLDPAFGTAGRSAVFGAGSTFGVQATAAAPDGGLYLLAVRTNIPTGDVYSYVSETVLYRLAADGTPAVGFPADGVVVPAPLPPPEGTVYIAVYWAGDVRQSLAVRADGSVAVAQSNGGPASVLLYTPAGELDTGFGEAGRAVLPGQTAYFGSYPAVLPAGENQLLVVASRDGKLVAARLTADGAVDPTYGTDGTAVVADEIVNYWYQSYAAVVAPDGGLLVGWTDAQRPTLVKLTPAGAADAAFGTGGRAQLAALPPESDGGGYYWYCDVGMPTGRLTLSVRPDGGILVVSTRNDRAAVLDLVTPAGAADASFAGDGRLHLRRYLAAGESVGDATPLPGGRVAVLVNVPGGANSGAQRVIALSAYDDPADPEYMPPPEPPAAVDPGYGDDGTVELRPTTPRPTDPPPGSVYWASPGVSKVLSLSGGGSLVVGRLTEPDGRSGLFVQRLLADGSPDPAFGTAGRVYLDTSTGFRFSAISDAAETSDGGFVLVAAADYYTTDTPLDGFPGTSRVVKLTAAGAIDRDFLAQANTDGGFDGLGNGSYSTLLVQPDGRILVGGWIHGGMTAPPGTVVGAVSVSRPAVRRLNPDGSPDTSFGQNGVARLDGERTEGGSVNALALDADGRVLLVGGQGYYGGYPYYYAVDSLTIGRSYYPYAYPNGKPFVARLTAAGALDTSFAGGVVSLDAQAGDGYSRAANWVTATADGGAVVGIRAGADTLRLVRLTAAGAIDTGYGKAGVSEVYDGRGFLGLTFGKDATAVIVTGVGFNFGERLGLYTVAPDGTLGSLGGLPLPAGETGQGVYAGGVAITPDGRVLVGFTWSTQEDGRIILERTDAATDLYVPTQWGEPAVWTPRPVPPLPVVVPPPELIVQPVFTPPPVPVNPVPNPESQSRPPISVAQPTPTPPAVTAAPVAVVRTDGPRVWVEEAGTGRVLLPAFAPFEASYTGGLDAVLADLDGDGVQELVVSPTDGGGPVVAVFRLDGAEVSRFWGIEDAGFRGGVRLAAGDVDGDGTADLVVTPGEGGGPRVAVYAGRSLMGGGVRRLVGDFYAFEESQRGGAYAAFVDGQLVFAAGPGGGPRVRSVDARGLLAASPTKLDDLPLAMDRFVGDPADRGGVRLLNRPEAGQVLASVGTAAPVPVAGRGVPADPLTLPGVWVG